VNLQEALKLSHDELLMQIGGASMQ